MYFVKNVCIALVHVLQVVMKVYEFKLKRNITTFIKFQLLHLKYIVIEKDVIYCTICNMELKYNKIILHFRGYHNNIYRLCVNKVYDLIGKKLI
jgi:hypothetical protein